MINAAINLAAGSTAGFLSDALLHPMDTITTRLWVQQGHAGMQYRYSGLTNGLKQMFSSEGLSGLYRGFAAVALLSPLGHGIYFASYFHTKALLSSMGSPVAGSSQLPGVFSGTGRPRPGFLATKSVLSFAQVGLLNSPSSQRSISGTAPFTRLQGSWQMRPVDWPGLPWTLSSQGSKPRYRMASCWSAPSNPYEPYTPSLG